MTGTHYYMVQYLMLNCFKYNYRHYLILTNNIIVSIKDLLKISSFALIKNNRHPLHFFCFQNDFIYFLHIIQTILLVEDGHTNGDSDGAPKQARYTTQAKQAFLERQKQAEEAAKNKSRPDIVS